MVAKVRTNRVFDGRMYGKTRPNSCTVDVRRSLDFELYLGFNDIDCDVKQEIPGKYASDVIIQVTLETVKWVLLKQARPYSDFCYFREGLGFLRRFQGRFLA